MQQKYDIIVLGGGVAGIAAAVSAKREGKKVLLIEKTLSLGGLATIGLINFFVPLCNGRGKQIIFGMAEELLRRSVKYGYDTIPEEWRNGEPGYDTGKRYITKFSSSLFSLALTELMMEEEVALLLDSLAVRPVMNGNRCEGIACESKSGQNIYYADMFIDTTGDLDIMKKAGVPIRNGSNYFTYIAQLIDQNSIKKAMECGDIGKAAKWVYGGSANLYGGNHPENMKRYSGTDVEDITEYVVKNQMVLLEKLKQSERMERDVVTLPAMPQFRTTCCIIGEHVFCETDMFKHHEHSIGVIGDFERKDYLYEIPYETLIHKEFPNFITAGRSASAVGYGWDVLRVIPPAIITGQAAGIAASVAVDDNTEIYDIDVAKLQKKLMNANVIIHFDDALIPETKEGIGERSEEFEHI